MISRRSFAILESNQRKVKRKKTSRPHIQRLQTQFSWKLKILSMFSTIWFCIFFTLKKFFTFIFHLYFSFINYVYIFILNFIIYFSLQFPLYLFFKFHLKTNFQFRILFSNFNTTFNFIWLQILNFIQINFLISFFNFIFKFEFYWKIKLFVFKYFWGPES